ncbi:MAG: guanylate kinase [Candidatus Neomarinimicrobiota bacterium]|jgi:guanylate kinase
MKQGLLIVFVSFSGGGKSTIIKALKEKHPDWVFSVSCTTRKPREGEIDGQHYYFIEKEEFLAKIEENAFLEYEHVHYDLYGTPREPLEKALNAGKVYILDIDVKGALNILREYPENQLSFFIDVPDMATLIDRLRKRGSESEEAIATRLSRIPEERKEKEKFDHVIINDILKDAVSNVETLIMNKLEAVQ